MLTTTTLHREEIKAQLRMKYGTIEAFEHARGLDSSEEAGEAHRLNRAAG
jgi:hypothetical protein